MNVLIVEDNRDIAESISDFLEMQGYTTDFATDALSAFHLISINKYDVYLLDISLPGTDGLTLCRRIREDANDHSPILFVTALDSLEDKIKGFEYGCDDYLVKPFKLEELLIRIKAIHRRSQPKNTAIIEIDTLRIDTRTHEATRDNTPVNLTPVGYKILLALAQASPTIVSREQLEDMIWKNATPDTDALRSHLYSLRQKIDKPFPYPLLHTIPKQGYRLYKA